MKKILYRILYMLCGGTMMLSLVPAIAMADDADCEFGFGESCFVSKIKTIGTEKKQESALLDTIKNAINWILGILATVAFVICLYAGFKMLTSGADSKGYDAGLKTLKNAAIGLAIIGLSRLIVSAIFWFIDRATGDPNTAKSGNGGGQTSDRPGELPQ